MFNTTQHNFQLSLKFKTPSKEDLNKGYFSSMVQQGLERLIFTTQLLDTTNGQVKMS